jgi:hypothetical protein
MFEFFQSHAGKAVVGVCLAGLLIVWPPSVSWIAAAALLQFGVRHLMLAFKEVERDEQTYEHITSGAPAIDPPHCERRIAPTRRGAVPARSPLE